MDIVEVVRCRGKDLNDADADSFPDGGVLEIDGIRRGVERENKCGGDAA